MWCNGNQTFENLIFGFDLIRYIFWPPILPRIVSKIAFVPQIPSYNFVFENNKWQIRLDKRVNYYCQAFLGRKRWDKYKHRLNKIDVFYSNTGRGNRIACLFIRAKKVSKYTILYSHSNATDLGIMSGILWHLRNKLKCNVLAYDYSGFGLSNGKPSENNIYSDIESAFHSLINRYGISPQSVILYGESMGSAATIDLSLRQRVAGVVLHSSFSSGLRAFFNLEMRKTWFFDPFPNIEKVGKIESPVLIIHGTKDKVVNITQAYALYNRCKFPVSPLWVKGAGHNYIQSYRQYYHRLKKFIEFELK
jgi:pimeloyl-ACP methyl ester carboxylesterase